LPLLPENDRVAAEEVIFAACSGSGARLLTQHARNPRTCGAGILVASGSTAWDTDVRHKQKLPRVLVIDDDAGTRFVLREALTDLGFEVVSAEDGAEAPDLVTEQHFDLLVVDLYMPGMNGFELLRQVRHSLLGLGAAQGTPSSVPILIISGEGQAASIDNAKRLGANAYLVKPLDIDELRRTVRHVLPANVPTLP
jgi:CheY-like chemotaxis protein